MAFCGVAEKLKKHINAKEESERALDEQWCLLQRQLSELEQWCRRNGKASFFTFFDTTIRASYDRYRKSRRSAWSVMKHVASWIFEAVIPAISAGIIYYLSCYSESPSVKSILFVCSFVLAWISIRSFLEWIKKKNAMETWARHSACFQHLHNTLGVFLFSERKEADYKQFVANVFAALEQNIDQFTLNMSSNGLAERKNNE